MQTQDEFMDQVLKYDDVLRRTALKFCHGNLPNSEDAIQNMYLKVLNHKDKYRFNVNLKAWLVRILYNIIMSDYRHKEVMRIKSTITDGMRDTISTKEDFSPEKDEISDDLTQGLNKLLPRHKQIFESVTEGLSYEEIAKKLECPVGSVMSGTWRARQALLRSIKDRNYHRSDRSDRALRLAMRKLI